MTAIPAVAVDGQPTAIPADMIADFGRLPCECSCQCGQMAQLTVTVHALDHCTEPAAQPLGNISQLLCIPCFNSLSLMTVHSLMHRYARGCTECVTCHQTVIQPPHVIREVRPL